MHWSWMKLSVVSILAWSGAALGQSSGSALTQAGEWIVRDFRFHTGEVLPELRLQYSTIGDPSGEPVLVLHGSNGSRQQFLSDAFAGELFGPGQPLDASRYYIVVPDNIGHGGSSKPSDGLKARFPSYNYDDMVRAQYRLVTEHLGIEHLRLIIGGSMGGMHAWMWGEKYPDFVDALMPLQCLPVEIAGVNRMLRRIATDSIRNDPAWMNGEYGQQPVAGMTIATYAQLALFTDPVSLYRSAPTQAEADEVLEKYVADGLRGVDANDMLYVLDASRDYDPLPRLDAIRARVFAINTEDDPTNPPELEILPELIRRVANGRYVLIPRTENTGGHGSYRLGRLYAPYLREILAE